MDTYRAFRVWLFGLTIVFYYETIGPGATLLGALLGLYRGQLRAFIAQFELSLLRWRVGVELRRRYW